MLFIDKNHEKNYSTVDRTADTKPLLPRFWNRLSQTVALTCVTACVAVYALSVYSLVNLHSHFSDDTTPFSTSEKTPPVISPATSVAHNNASTYAKELAQIDSQLSAKKAFAAAHPDSELHLTKVAEAYFERARLSGEFTDYASALNTLQSVFAMEDHGNGPVLLRARLNYSLHRLPSIEPDLLTAQSALLVNKPTNAKIEGIRADVLLQQGQYDNALQTYEELDKNHPDSTSAIRIAQANAYTGDHAEAEHWFAVAENRAPLRSSQLRSWLALQLGILDLERGRLDEALVHYQRALELFPGYWLVEEHIAEIDALQGRTDKAEHAYRDLINRTGSPQFMIALADILLQRDGLENNEATELLEQANHVFTSMASQIPEAIAGHALEYFLQQGNPKQALQLAMDNYRLRAGGPSAVLLAQAHAINGQLSEASTVLDKLLTTPYRSADLHATAGVVYRASGFNDRADHQEQLARTINPGAVESNDWLWVGIEAIN